MEIDNLSADPRGERADPGTSATAAISESFSVPPSCESWRLGAKGDGKVSRQLLLPDWYHWVGDRDRRPQDPMVRRKKRTKRNPELGAESHVVDTDGWYDRREAAKVLRCAVNTIINRQNAGKLHPRWAVRRDCRGAERMQLVYDPKELARFAPSRYVDRHRSPGETAALCFEAFGAGKRIREIVTDLRETPDAVEALYQQWETCGGDKRVVTDTAWEALQQQVGPMDDVTDLVERVRSLKEALKAKP